MLFSFMTINGWFQIFTLKVFWFYSSILEKFGTSGNSVQHTANVHDDTMISILLHSNNFSIPGMKHSNI